MHGQYDRALPFVRGYAQLSELVVSAESDFARDVRQNDCPLPGSEKRESRPALTASQIRLPSRATGALTPDSVRPFALITQRARVELPSADIRHVERFHVGRLRGRCRHSDSWSITEVAVIEFAGRRAICVS